jgi:hypothetical protein
MGSGGAQIFLFALARFTLTLRARGGFSSLSTNSSTDVTDGAQMKHNGRSFKASLPSPYLRGIGVICGLFDRLRQPKHARRSLATELREVTEEERRLLISSIELPQGLWTATGSSARSLARSTTGRRRARLVAGLPGPLGRRQCETDQVGSPRRQCLLPRHSPFQSTDRRRVVPSAREDAWPGHTCLHAAFRRTARRQASRSAASLRCNARSSPADFVEICAANSNSSRL